MANNAEGSGLPMEASSTKIPPGWRPGIASYPLRRYIQLLRLWWRTTELIESQAGPAMTLRLKGSAFQVALRLSTTRIATGPIHPATIAADGRNAGDRFVVDGDACLSLVVVPVYVS